MKYVYDLIEDLCKKNDITVTKLCRDCNIPRSSLTDYKKGRIKSLSTDTLCKISDYFEVSVSYLCGDDKKLITEEELKTAIFGSDIIVSDEMWNDLKKYIAFLKCNSSSKDIK